MKIVDAEEEGNFTFRAGADEAKEAGRFPTIAIEAQGMETAEISQKEA